MMGIGEHLLEPYGASLAKISLDGDRRARRPADRQVRRRHGDHADAARRGQDHHDGRARPGDEAHRQERRDHRLRQPSMGPTFGIKGGAAGGGYSQVIPMELLNLHLTGDFHAVTAAHNLLSAMIDNHLHQGNELGLDLDNITWRRVLDVNDRSLRNIVVGLGGKEDGVTRQTGFDITAASEVMAILALSTSMRRPAGPARADRRRLHEDRRAGHRRAAARRRVDGRDHARRAQAQPAADDREHAGDRPRRAVRQHRPRQLVGRRRPDRHPRRRLPASPRPGSAPTWAPSGSSTSSAATSGLMPDAAVLVATVRALKAHSGKYQIVAGKPLPAGAAGGEPRRRRSPAPPTSPSRSRTSRCTASRRSWRSTASRPTTPPSTRRSARSPRPLGARVAVCTHFATAARARPIWRTAVVEACEEPSGFHFLYKDSDTLKQKIETVATTIYGAERVEYTPGANKQLDELRGQRVRQPAGVHRQDPPVDLRRRQPEGRADRSHAEVREARASVGAGFVYPICGEMRTMPGLGSAPAASIIDFDENGEIVGPVVSDGLIERTPAARS